MRVLPLDRIPNELWSKNVLRLPTAAVNCYVDELEAWCVLEDAKKGTDKKAIHGGCSYEETLEHFTYRFCVSSFRI